MKSTRRFFVGLVVFALALSALLFWLEGGFETTMSTTRSWPYGEPILIEAQLYKQNDPAWADERIGGSGEKIRAAGCTLCSMAMLLAHHGVRVNPAELNSFLKDSGGYTSSGLLVWDKCTQFAPGRVRMDYYGPARRDIVEKNLAAGNPVIVKVLTRRGDTHWVLIVGTRGRDYLINDPAGRGDSPGKLSAYGDRVYALRVFGAQPSSAN